MRLRLIILLVIMVAVVIGGVVLLRERVTCALFLRAVPADAVAFLRREGAFMMNAEGSTPCLVSEGPYTYVGWTPDGSQLTLSNLDRDLFFANPDGSNMRLVATGSNGDERVPYYSLSPTSDDIAGLRRVEDHYEVVVYDAPGAEPRFIVPGVSAETPVWSPDGTRLAFLSEPTALNVVNADGSDLRQLSEEAYPSMYPFWSADGTSIYFLATNFEFSQIAPDGTEAVEISDFETQAGGQVFDYALSPDRQTMAVSVLLSPPFQIPLFVFDLRTKAVTRLTQEEGLKVSDPAWSANGAWIYVREYDDAPVRFEGLFRVDPVTGAKTRLTNGAVPAPRPNG
jgi:Tol biopolymer transport system component